MPTFNEILSYIRSAIPELTNTSAAAFDEKIASAIAPNIDNTISEIANSESIITNIIGSQRYGRGGYYQQKALEYQEGVDLTVDANLNPVYASVDTSKLLIKQAAFDTASSGNNQILTLKVAALDTDTNSLRALTTEEKEGFDNYFVLFEIPGLPVNKVSLDANIFDFSAKVTYYATYDFNNIVNEITSQLYNFRNTFNFNGVLYVNDLETYLKSNIPGIRNVSLSNTTIDGDSFENEVVLLSGYFDYPAGILTGFTYVAI